MPGEPPRLRPRPANRCTSTGSTSRAAPPRCWSRPAGRRCCMDAGWADARGGASRIDAGAGAEAGAKQLDYFFASHYHVDHLSGIASLARAIPIMNFVDHGTSVEGGTTTATAPPPPGASAARHEAGQKVQLGDVEVTILTAAGQVVEPLPSATANPLCAGRPGQERRRRRGSPEPRLPGPLRHLRVRRPRRSHLGRRAPAGLPHEPHRPDRDLPGQPARLGRVEPAAAGARPGPAGRRGQQRRRQGRRDVGACRSSSAAPA